MNKRLFLLLILIFSTILGIFADELFENEYFIKSLEYKELAEKAYDDAEYEKTIEYSRLAAEYAEKSDKYIEFMLKKFRANTALVTAERRIRYAQAINLPEDEPELFNKANQLAVDARKMFESEDFDNSRIASLEAIELLKDIKKKASNTKPKYYVVQLNVNRRDCFWIIASYDFIYGDPTLWEKIYEANKDKLADPDNPDLIHPGTILEIPEIDGETREGTHNPEK
ncbi:MAG: LysM peptidoglycan-binding domain-containing protein [Spirochaetales bacterium]|nr:LysM peptidoglycan-binding domain-containing protein [Spirochaetales bacterium]